MNKPETVSFWNYLKISCFRVKAKFAAIMAQHRYRRQKRRGMWYCAYCDKMHHKRVIEHQIADGMVDSVCSLGRAEYLKYNPKLEADQQYTPNDFRALVAGQPAEHYTAK